MHITSKLSKAKILRLFYVAYQVSGVVFYLENIPRSLTTLFFKNTNYSSSGRSLNHDSHTILPYVCAFHKINVGYKETTNLASHFVYKANKHA